MKNDKVTRNFIICFDEFLVIFGIERKEVRMMKNRKIFAIVLILLTIMVSSGCNEKNRQIRMIQQKKRKWNIAIHWK